METLYDSEFQTISFDQETCILHERWKPETEKMNDTIFKTEMLNQLKAAKTAHPQSVITDTLQMNYVISVKMQEWMNITIFPEFIQSGITKIAILLTEELITQLSVEQTMEEEEGSKFSVLYFSDKKEAEKWLQKI